MQSEKHLTSSQMRKKRNKWEVTICALLSLEYPTIRTSTRTLYRIGPHSSPD